MLMNDFYFVSNESADEATYRSLIRFDAGHRIFEGHFPGQPVVPGVCMLQLVQESFGAHVGSKLELVKASSLKFLLVIDPRITPTVTLQLKYKINAEGCYIVDAQLSNEGTNYFKMKGEFNSVKDQQGN